MLDTETKRRIDTARDILVGKVPDPKSQVEQITIALIYKFMNDMDAESEKLGGKRQFFTGDFAGYSWATLMRPGLGGHETLSLYAEGLTKMTEHPGLPPLFRDIFKNAYLTYRDPETLKSFLKTIDGFTYDHSERLGDAFEYLLAILGSQGDAGQFRTPRHIIDFIVKIIKPKKDETILDPACGTAGFLISAYKYIERANSGDKGHGKLTPAERERLAQNIIGYDISPDMVRLSLVNLYLHGFAAPRIHEYDTLTQEERWNEYADVILANPPFMSPKGGIRPHKRFSIQAKRSEVLFVNYMAEHLTPAGRAGIIVPEGIIFQSQSAYRDLRKMLVETSLVAVISLPAGCFNPYSGVKTSILILDKNLAKQAKTIAFFKVENDGYGLGTQRRPIDKNDLPQVLAGVEAYLAALATVPSASSDSLDTPNPSDSPSFALIVSKEKIAVNGDYNLSGERYREEKQDLNHYPMVPLETVVKIESGSRQKGGAIEKGIPSIGGEQIDGNGEIRFDKMKYVSEEHFKKMTKGMLKKGDVLIVKDGATTGKTGVFDYEMAAAVNEHVFLLRASQVIESQYLYRCIRAGEFQDKLQPYIKGIIGGISLEFGAITIPLPPLEVQKKIMAEIEGYQKVINGARSVIDNYHPHMPINPDWPMVKLGAACVIQSGGTPNRSENSYWHGVIPWVGSTVCKGSKVIAAEEFITEAGLNNSAAKLFPKYTTLIALVGATIGKTALLMFESTTNQNIAGLFPKSSEVLDPIYLFHAAQNLYPLFIRLGEGKFRMANLSFVREQKIPLPPLETQRAIVAEIETEQALVAANHGLIARMEKKIQSTLARVWGKTS